MLRCADEGDEGFLMAGLNPVESGHGLLHPVARVLVVDLQARRSCGVRGPLHYFDRATLQVVLDLVVNLGPMHVELFFRFGKRRQDQWFAVFPSAMFLRWEVSVWTYQSQQKQPHG